MPSILDTLVDYSRQAEMNTDLQHVHYHMHFIIGCGGIGYWVGLLLAMMGAPHIVLIDGDRIEASNLNRIPTSPRYTGKHKVNALKAQIRVLRPGVRITCLPVHITEETFEVMNTLAPQMRSSTALVWDCTDDARIQQKIYTWCGMNARKYVKIGYEGWKVGMYREMSMWLPDDYRPGYTSTKTNALTSIIAAAMGIMYAGRNNINDVEVDLKNIVEGR